MKSSRKTMNQNLKVLLVHLKSLRSDKGLSLRKIQEKSGLSRGTISDLENFKIINPTVNTLYHYAEAIGFTIEMKVSVR